MSKKVHDVSRNTCTRHKTVQVVANLIDIPPHTYKGERYTHRHTYTGKEKEREIPDKQLWSTELLSLICEYADVRAERRIAMRSTGWLAPRALAQPRRTAEYMILLSESDARASGRDPIPPGLFAAAPHVRNERALGKEIRFRG